MGRHNICGFRWHMPTHADKNGMGSIRLVDVMEFALFD